MHHDSAMARQARRAPGYLETLSVQRHEAIDGVRLRSLSGEVVLGSQPSLTQDPPSSFLAHTSPSTHVHPTQAPDRSVGSGHRRGQRQFQDLTQSLAHMHHAPTPFSSPSLQRPCHPDGATARGIPRVPRLVSMASSSRPQSLSLFHHSQIQ